MCDRSMSLVTELSFSVFLSQSGIDKNVKLVLNDEKGTAFPGSKKLDVRALTLVLLVLQNNVTRNTA